MTGVALGIDVGGTSSEAVALDESGAVVGRGSAGGGNPHSNGAEQAARNVAEAATTALGRHELLACVLGMPGSAFNTPAVQQAFAPFFSSMRPRLITDSEVAFAAGTRAPDGAVLIAGTGSIAVRIADRARVATSGGYGWLLGDEGSAFWIGREAVRATLRAVMAGTAFGRLALSVLEAVDAPVAHSALASGKVIAAVNRERPIRLARFAPLVSLAAIDDPVAAGILERAAQSLAGQVLDVHRGGPIVLAGGVLRTPVGARVRELLTGRELLDAPDPALGAAWLAAVDAFGPDAPRPRI
ncbi:BadF/BadG/BcrA/BcrD ATPase family protein [Actinokineospora auranticolor]|uniref:N-acetylglucosamine kinase-like BadF-type ATPase n=1 Tax=Actinokineospora auranticolor TaxID=155976 RepID=A0A2S6GZF4_9PSEU|nr:BadF/BadG/BcrA/BcrD ATPase family protein [Actinokineospora auranticolor]PPK70603.1 N-acetylglucosamine kinase-like BadF-type ATPase [Actinokineospora auranticolor]